MVRGENFASSSTLIRLGRLAAVVAGVLLVIAELMYLIVGFQPSAESFTSASGFVQNGYSYSAAYC